MTGRSLLLLAAAAAALGACTANRAGPAAAVPATGVTQWRMVATRDDHRRVRDWRKAWVEALDQAGPGHEREIEAEGPLLDPDAALPDPAPPPGEYRCRTLKLGAQGGTGLDYIPYPAFRCRIEAQGDGSLAFARIDGAQRAVGRIFPENSRRMVFLGTLQLGDEQGTLRYGHDQARNLAAIVERVGERRWRLAFPYPHYESTLDVVELVPASPA